MKKLIQITALALIGNTLASNPVKALTFTYDRAIDNVTSTDYIYDLELATGEELVAGTPLIISELAAVTGATANAIYNSPGASDLQSVTFNVANDVSSTAPRTYGDIITLTSTSQEVGAIEYSYFSNTPPFNGATSGPVAATPVPFEVSPSLGVAVLMAIVGFRKLKQKFGK